VVSNAGAGALHTFVFVPETQVICVVLLVVCL
jgi:hypothetical protein